MGYASEVIFKHYMVEFDSGRTAHIGGEDIEEVRDYCKQNYADNKIHTIYLEVFVADGE